MVQRFGKGEGERDAKSPEVLLNRVLVSAFVAFRCLWMIAESILGFVLGELLFLGVPRRDRKDSEVADEVLRVYEQKGFDKIRDLYDENALFEDPIMRVKGIKQIRLAFASIGLLFNKVRMVRCSPIWQSNDKLVIYTVQEYTLKRLELPIAIPARIELTFGPNGKISKHMDYILNLPIPSKANAGILGAPFQMLRDQGGQFICSKQAKAEQ
mmetsp:Transcript_1010/g.3156  ORF Transcript_1010/g.3156 Transcript_1010/m.3156 type:complete len:212 (-) Transcript_1010:1928-2563(-)